jgi:hypothetical protein
MDVFIISSLPSLCWRHCKWQGPFAQRTLLRFIATTDPAATLSSSADFPVSPVIRPTMLRRFRAGTRRASPVARHVLVTVLSLPPRRDEQSCRSVFGCSCCLRPMDASSALGANNLQQSWRFDWEPPKAVLRDVRTTDWILGRLKSSAQTAPIAGRPILGF